MSTGCHFGLSTYADSSESSHSVVHGAHFGCLLVQNEWLPRLVVICEPRNVYVAISGANGLLSALRENLESREPTGAHSLPQSLAALRANLHDDKF